MPVKNKTQVNAKVTYLVETAAIFVNVQVAVDLLVYGPRIRAVGLYGHVKPSVYSLQASSGT